MFPLIQFEDGILDICLMLLDVNPKFLRDAGRDCSRRSSPVYVGRVVSRMVSVAGLTRAQGPTMGPRSSSLPVMTRPCSALGTVGTPREWISFS